MTNNDDPTVSPEDEGAIAVVEYQSVYHPDADPSTVEGVIDQVSGGMFWLEDENDRILEVTPSSVVTHRGEDGEHRDVAIGTNPDVSIERVFEVAMTGAGAVVVRAEDAQSARTRAINNTDFGDLHSAVDRNAAQEVDPGGVNDSLRRIE